MASNDDLMKFLIDMEKKREQEKVEMAEIRKKERQEDRKEMMKLMEDCIGEKVGELIEPYKEKTEKLEKGQQEMKEQVNMLMGQMSEILSSRQEEAQQGSRVSDRLRVSLQPHEIAEDTRIESQEEKRRYLISLSRRTIGLQRIDKHDIQRMYQEQYGGARSEEEARLLAVKEYFRLELKLSEGIIEEFDIERIFTPARENPEWLYVTFRCEASVSRVFEKTRIMRKDSRIIPREYHSRFQAMKELGNQLRIERDCKTRIKMGHRDLQLHKKERDTGKWELVELPANLPPANFESSPEKVQTGSPAPGRPEQSRHVKRSRESTGSNGDKNAAKALRAGREENKEGMYSSEVVDNSELANTSRDTTGKVMGEESYCPASPAPAKHSQDFPYSSPIFQKNKTKQITIF